jgi:hypothetical protein
MALFYTLFDKWCFDWTVFDAIEISTPDGFNLPPRDFSRTLHTRNLSITLPPRDFSRTLHSRELAVTLPPRDFSRTVHSEVR